MISFSLVVFLPLFLAGVFPFQALQIKPLSTILHSDKTKFHLVNLSIKQEKDFLVLARSAWQTKGQSVSSTSLDVPMDLPEIEPGKLETIFEIDMKNQLPFEEYKFLFYPHTEALGSPMQLDTHISHISKEQPFSKTELTTLPE
jgi:hypothetical protein